MITSSQISSISERLCPEKKMVFPEEFKSKKSKIFVTADDGNEIEIINNLGFQAVPLEWPDVLLSLQTGLVDTVPVTPFYALASQYDLVAKHLLELDYVPLVGATVVTKKTWTAFTEEQRQAFKKAALEAGKQIQTKSRAESNEAVEAMKSADCRCIPFRRSSKRNGAVLPRVSIPRCAGR